MYILTLEEEDFPYPIKTEIQIPSLSMALLAIKTQYSDYKFVSLVNNDSFYGKIDFTNGLK